VSTYNRAYYLANREKILAASRAWAIKNKDKKYAATRRWYYSPKGRASFAKTKEKRYKMFLRLKAMNPKKYQSFRARWYYERGGQDYARAYKDANREKQREHRRKWYAKNRLGLVKLYGAVARALKRGTIKKMPCQQCGSRKDIRAAHNSKTKPFDITWLCRTHHMARYVKKYTIFDRARLLARSL